jgi:hypothetical protein
MTVLLVAEPEFFHNREYWRNGMKELCFRCYLPIEVPALDPQV